MTNNKFKTPLIQSAIILGAVIVLFVVLGAGDTDAAGNSISVLSNAGHAILFCIALPISIAFCIVVMIAIFLGAVAMVDSGQASQMFSDIKKKRAS